MKLLFLQKNRAVNNNAVLDPIVYSLGLLRMTIIQKFPLNSKMVMKVEWNEMIYSSIEHYVSGSIVTIMVIYENIIMQSHNNDSMQQ